MESVTRTFQIVAGIAVVGALVETFVPGLITEKLKGDFSAITISIIGILFSYLLLMILLKARIREGFEDTRYETQWKTMVEENKVKEVCAFYNELYEKMYIVEKGAPPAETKTDAQAREAVAAFFAKEMTQSPINCKDFEEVNSKVNSVDGFYLSIQKLSPSFLAQVYDTANGCRRLMIGNYLKLKDTQNQRKEGFEDKPLCTDAAETERRDFLKRKPLSADAQKCLLIEEIPPEKKLNYIYLRLDQMQTTFDQYKKQQNIQDSITKVLADCQYYKEEMEKMKREAEDTSNKYNTKA
jgi:hypothetical protein